MGGRKRNLVQNQENSVIPKWSACLFCFPPLSEDGFLAGHMAWDVGVYLPLDMLRGSFQCPLFSTVIATCT